MKQYEIDVGLLEAMFETGNIIDKHKVLKGIEGKIMDAQVMHGPFNGGPILRILTEDGSMKMEKMRLEFQRIEDDDG